MAPTVLATTPAAGSLMPLPLPAITVTFDQDMFVGAATDAASVINPANYALLQAGGGTLAINSVSYDAATRTATLHYDPLTAGDFLLQVKAGIKTTQHAALAQDYFAGFTTLLNYSESLTISLTNTRSHRADGTISYDVRGHQYRRLTTCWRRSTLVLDPSQYFAGSPAGQFSSSEGLWLIDLSAGADQWPLAAGTVDHGTHHHHQRLAWPARRHRPWRVCAADGECAAGHQFRSGLPKRRQARLTRTRSPRPILMALC